MRIDPNSDNCFQKLNEFIREVYKTWDLIASTDNVFVQCSFLYQYWKGRDNKIHCTIQSLELLVNDERLHRNAPSELEVLALIRMRALSNVVMICMTNKLNNWYSSESTDVNVSDQSMARTWVLYIKDTNRTDILEQ